MKWVNKGENLLFPPSCFFCHVSVSKSGCCKQCLQHIKPLLNPSCLRCGQALSEGLAPGPCGKCLHFPPFQIETVSLYAYQGAVREAILIWKLGGDDAGVRWLVETARQRLKTLFQPDDLFIPVPMPFSRMQKSGQHHAADLARLLAEAAGCEWDWQLLRRHGHQARQSALSGLARRKNLRKSFCLDTDYLTSMQLKGILRKPVKGRVWVVDDIMTTGATLHYASKALGVLQQPIYAFSLARTLRDR